LLCLYAVSYLVVRLVEHSAIFDPAQPDIPGR
jgi:hypothetical protein